MTINYICEGFDKDFYNFDAVVVPVLERISKSKQELRSLRWQFIDDFYDDFDEIIQKLPINTFESGRVKSVRSEKTDIYYIFVLTGYKYYVYDEISEREKHFIRKFNYCREEMVKCVNELDIKNILIPPLFNQYDICIEKNDDFFVNILKSNIDRFSQKKIYIIVKKENRKKNISAILLHNMEKGTITPEECRQIYVENQIKQSISYINNLLRIAEIETRYKPKTIAEQFREDMNNDSWFFYEYINRYQGTATDLAKKAGIDKSTISTIKSHKYNEKSRKVVISLAIALDLTVDDRKRFINSAGFSYPITEHDRFIEQQLRKKRYKDVREFNEDIWNEYPEFVIETRSSRGYKKSDK